MQNESNKVAIIVKNYFTEFQFDDALKNLSNVGHVDIISSDSGKIKSWDKSEKEYHTVVLYKNEIQRISAMDYNTIIVHEDIINDEARYMVSKIATALSTLWASSLSSRSASCS